MPLSTDHLILATVIICCFGFVGAAGLVAGHFYDRLSGRFSLRRSMSDESRHCRYCYFGRADVREENATVEDNDLVEVRCFVCRSCGLPQWHVQRSPVLRQPA